MTDQIILHHYDGSPFAEKVRLMLGLKGLSWRGVDIPTIMPKPDLMPLTGGYRKTPVMQIGADIYCDTKLIAEELERRHPETSMMKGGSGMANVISAFTEGQMFWTVAGLVMGTIADHMPDAFHQDRARMRGAAGADIDKLKAAAPLHREQLKPQLAWMNDLFADGRDWIAADGPGLADLTAYHPLWFMSRGGKAVRTMLDDYPALQGFMARVAGIGHGTMTEMASGEALDIAQAAAPAPGRSVAENAEGWAEGDAVAIMPTDYARDPVKGTLVTYNGGEIALHRSDDRVGDVVVHFPRVGFAIRRT